MKLKQYVKVYGVCLLFASFLVMAYTFVLAYNDESKTVLVMIDEKGEADIEMFILIPITAILGTIALIYTIKDEKEELIKECQKY